MFDKNRGSRTFKDLRKWTQVLLSTYIEFQDFQGLDFCNNKNPALSSTFKEAWKP
jgi:hypothetical protein